MANALPVDLDDFRLCSYSHVFLGQIKSNQLGVSCHKIVIAKR